MQKKNEDVLCKQIVDSSEANNIYKRSLYYWASLYYTQLKKGQKYKTLHPAITINILDFALFDDKRSNRKFILKYEQTNEEYLRMIEMHFVELNKRKYMDTDDALWKWAEFLKSPDSENLQWIYESTACPEVTEAIEHAKKIFYKALTDPENQETIKLIEKAEKDKLSAIETARDKGLAEGLEKGKEEGLVEGLEKGIQKGKKEGLAEGEHRKAIATAKNMLSKGLDIELVSQCTGLTTEEIKSLI